MLNQCEKFEMSDYHRQISLEFISQQKADFQKLRILWINKTRHSEITYKLQWKNPQGSERKKLQIEMFLLGAPKARMCCFL